MAKTPSSNGKGSARRRENLAKVRENWDSIDWSKGRPAAKKLAEDFGEAAGRVLLEDYADSGKKAEWVIPPLEQLLGREKYGPLAPEIVELASRDHTAKCADDQFWTKHGVFLNGDPLASDAENDLNEQMQEDDDLRPY